MVDLYACYLIMYVIKKYTIYESILVQIHLKITLHLSIKTTICIKWVLCFPNYIYIGFCSYNFSFHNLFFIYNSNVRTTNLDVIAQNGAKHSVVWRLSIMLFHVYLNKCIFIYSTIFYYRLKLHTYESTIAGRCIKQSQIVEC